MFLTYSELLNSLDSGATTFITLAMIFCVVFTSCGKSKSNSDGSVSSAGNPFDIENSGNENSTIGSYRFGLRDDQGDGNFTYNGQSVRIPMFICGDEVKTEVGFLAFADGIAQSYEIQIDGKTIAENEQMHIFNLAPSETIEFDLKRQSAALSKIKNQPVNLLPLLRNTKTLTL